MTSQRDVINETMVSDVQQWQYNFIIVLVFSCRCVLTEKNRSGTYSTPLVLPDTSSLTVQSTNCQAAELEKPRN